ncbi:MmgE/PrpD family protein [Rhodococcoides kyotonense]|uniref:2-methylcitrate dehydratase PrpD n=1 Tax=Rhodococcoides kyotonense TaxID=398843 RepID=A0A239IKL9_9NOCA|nr:MmgE/PrpD family protein [Rhodococcus kyotonensis]SNS93778.1 2-methylcitrate dehydratase PrpD [Rhodococcus kyotonensis]
MSTAVLAEWALSVDELPDEVRRAASRHLLDGVGNAVAAARLGAGAAGWSVATALGGSSEARPLTGTQPLSAPAAAMASAVLVHALDFDDTHAGALVHPTVVSLPAAFAVGQETGATGAEILTAFALGLETACRLGAVSPHGFHARGMHATGVVGPLSSAVVAGRLLGLSPSVLVHALGIAGSSSAGLLEFLDSDADTKSLHPGSAGFNGILAARLAAAGAGGPASVLEGKRGLYAALSDRPADLAVLTADLGTSWESTRIGIKPYPSCQLMHVTLDAVKAAGFSSGEITDIEVFVHPDSRPIVCGPNAGVAAPRSTYDGKFDLPWSVAALLHDGAVTVGTYTPESIARHEVLDTARAVRVTDMTYDGPAASAPGRALITLSDGSVLEGRVDGSRGSAAFPLDDAGLREKFLSNCGNHSSAPELADLLLTLDDQPDLTAVLDLAADISR